MHTKPFALLVRPRPHVEIPTKHHHAFLSPRPLHKRPRLPRLRHPRRLHPPRRARLHVRPEDLQLGRPPIHAYSDEPDAFRREAIDARDVRVPLPAGVDDLVPAEEQQAGIDDSAGRSGRVVAMRVRGLRQQGLLVRKGLVQDDDVVGVQERGDGEGAGVGAPVW